MPRKPTAVDRGGERLCRLCEQYKPLPDFIKNKSGTKGYDTRCKLCFREQVNSDRAQKRAERLEAENAHYEANKAEIDAQRAAEAAERAERKRQYDRDYKKQNPDRVAVYTKRWRLANPDKAKARHLRRRAREAGAYSEPYSRTEVFERDAWVCQLCSESVDPNASYWLEDGSINRWYPSVDHINPLSKGGTDTFDNVQLAHLRCNASKQNRALEAIA